MERVRLPGVIENDPGYAAIMEHVMLARSISAKLRSLREGAGLSQAALAKRLGVSQPRISQTESGKIDESPSIEFIAKYAHACEGRAFFAVERLAVAKAVGGGATGRGYEAPPVSPDPAAVTAAVLLARAERAR